VQTLLKVWSRTVLLLPSCRIEGGNEMSAIEIEKDFLETSAKIQSTEIEMLNLQNEIESTEKKLAKIENTTSLLIASAEGKDGKKVFTNELSRTTAIKEKLEQSIEFIQGNDLLIVNKNKLTMLVITRDFLKRHIKFFEVFVKK
jgi:hypothetical protein